MQGVVAKPKFFQRLGAVVGEEHIGAVHQRQHGFHAEFRGEVHAQRAFPAVSGHILGTQSAFGGMVVVAAQVAGRVAHGRLHLDHLRAHVA